MINEILPTLNDNAGILAVLALLGSAFKYFHLQTREANQKQFEEYHNLIERLVSHNPNGGPIYLERQTAIIFELRNFSRYYPFTIRVLENLKSTISERKNLPPTDPNYLQPTFIAVLQREIEFTVKFIKEKKCWLIFKCYRNDII